MTPDYLIIADSQDVTGIIRDRLLSLSVTDISGRKSDIIEIQLDDRDGIEIPRTGATLEISLGYKKELVKMGTFVVDEVEMNSPPSTMTIRAKAGNMLGTLKSCQNRNWENITIGEIINIIAAEHGYVAKVSSNLAVINVDHIVQFNESDLNFLTRLAIEEGFSTGAVFKPVNGLLLFVNAGETKTASGQDLPTISLTPNSMTTWRATNIGRNRYGTVLARYRDRDTAKDIYLTSGSGEPTYCDKKIHKDQTTAQKIADAKLKSLSSKTQTLAITMPGNPDMAAETKLLLSGFRTGVDGEWTIKQAVHKIDKNTGYTTSVQAEIKN